MESCEAHEIVIIGGGICGLATALALHREGIKSIVLEKSDTRETGAAIMIYQNGWMALDYLGLSKLRDKAYAMKSGSYLTIPEGKRFATTEVGNGDARCLRRTDLIRALADALPPGVLRDGLVVQSVQIKSNSPYSAIHLADGSILQAKIVIGCDGVNSVVAKALELGSMELSQILVTRGFTYYEDRHELPQSLNIWTSQDGTFGHVPVNHNLVYWFQTRRRSSQDSAIWEDQVLIKEATLEAVEGCPGYVIDIVKNSDVNSLSLKSIKYRPPLDLLTTKFRKGTVIVAGDAVHAMAPFLAQGGALSLEDAVVLAKTLAPKLRSAPTGFFDLSPDWKKKIEAALDEFMEKRRMRVFWVSLQAHLRDLSSNIGASSMLIKWLSLFLLAVLFRDEDGHMNFDCLR